MIGQDRVKGNIVSKHWMLIFFIALLFLLVNLFFTINWPVSVVKVYSVPSGAVLTTVDGYSWILPAEIGIPEEGLFVTAAYPGRVSVDTLIQSTDISSITLALPYIFSVEITSEPMGAEVFFNSEVYGTTPLVIEFETAGTHAFELILDQTTITRDSFTVLSNQPVHRHYLLPYLLDNGMICVPNSEWVITLPDSADIPEESGGEDYLIAVYEVTNREFCEYIRYLEPIPNSDSTWRWGRTDLIEELFPGDFPIPFCIGENGEWSVFEGLDNYPVAGMSVRAAVDYCDWLTSMDRTGMVYRLPTATEWTQAALAGGNGPYPWGDARPEGTLLNLSDSKEGMLRRHPSIDDGFPTSSPVGSFESNDWGLYDMAGNVWEWCMSDDSTTYVAKGGSWLSSMDDCMCGAVFFPDTTLGFPFVGFRIAATIIRDGGVRGD